MAVSVSVDVPSPHDSEFDSLSQRLDETLLQFALLGAKVSSLSDRVTALEQNKPPPDSPPDTPPPDSPPDTPPPDSPPDTPDTTPSADKTKISQPGEYLISSKGMRYELVVNPSGPNYAIAKNGVIDPDTHGVTEMVAMLSLKLIFQLADGWYYATDDVTWWGAGQTDPTLPPPDSPPDTPPPPDSPPDTPPPPDSPPDVPDSPPSDTAPSADKTVITKPGEYLISSKGMRYELVQNPSGDNYAISKNGVIDPDTHGVTMMVSMLSLSLIFQLADGWYYATDDATWWGTGQADPTLPPPDNPPVIDPPDNVDPPPQGDGPQLISVYEWNYGDGQDASVHDADMTGFENAIGMPNGVKGTDLFPLWGTEKDWAGNLAWTIAAMKQSSKPGIRNAVPVVGLQFWMTLYGWNDIKGLQANAAGVLDSNWRAIVDALADQQVPRSIIRLGYENNYNFMVSGWGWDPEMQQTWKAAFEHVSDVMLERADDRKIELLMCFNPVLGQGSADVASVMPARGKFQIFGLDFYNAYYGNGDVNNPDDRRRFWMTDATFSFSQALQLAKQVGVGMFFPECGAGPNPNGAQYGLANDTVFVQCLRDAIGQIRAAGLPWWGLTYWDVDPGDAQTRFSDGSQKLLQAAVAASYQDGTFVGDKLPSLAPATLATAHKMAAMRRPRLAMPRSGLAPRGFFGPRPSWTQRHAAFTQIGAGRPVGM